MMGYSPVEMIPADGQVPIRRVWRVGSMARGFQSPARPRSRRGTGHGGPRTVYAQPRSSAYRTSPLHARFPGSRGVPATSGRTANDRCPPPFGRVECTGGAGTRPAENPVES